MEQKILFGLTLPVNESVRETVEQEAGRLVPQMQCVCRYRKEGVFQYAKQQQERLILVLEENLQGGSLYTQEDILQLTDLGNCRIIFLADGSHKGDAYMHFLYACGIYDALYLEDVTAEQIIGLLKSSRGCEKAREYYGIQTLRDAEKSYDVINEKLLDTYLEYLEKTDEPEETNARYRFAAMRLGNLENRTLAGSITAPMAGRLCGNEVFQFYRDGTKARHRRAVKKQEPEPLKVESEAVTEREGNTATSCGEEDMFAVMERFRRAGTNSADGRCKEETPAEGLLFQMGSFLRTVDA